MSDIEKMISNLYAIRRHNKIDVVNVSGERHIINRVADLVGCSLDDRISVAIAIARHPMYQGRNDHIGC